MKHFNINILILIALTMGSEFSIASGGWVGNSPAQVANYKPSPYTKNSMSSDQVAEFEEWNSLLLPKGMSRFDFDWQMLEPKYANARNYFTVSYKHAFTEKLMTNTFMNWGYSLLSGNGQGHEIATYFGIYGLGWSTSIGLVMTPGVGLGYAYTDGPWRFTSKFLTLNSYYFDDSEWGRMQIQFDNDISYTWNDKWSTGLALQTNFVENDDQFEKFELRNSKDFVRPALTVNRRLKNFGASKQDLEIYTGIGLDDVRNSNIGVSWSW